MSDNPYGWISDAFNTIANVIDAFDGGPGPGLGSVPTIPTPLASGLFGPNFPDITDTLGLTTPARNGQVNQGGCVIEMPVSVVSRAACAPGYVVVQKPGQGKSCMLKEHAIACKLWKRPRKPPISVKDMNCLRRSSSVVTKMDRVVKMTNKITGKAPMRRVRPQRKN